MKSSKCSAMTLRAYRITPTGHHVEISQRTISLRPGAIEISSVWPPCACPRCRPADGQLAESA
ncbi:hypothetical protein P3T37_006797 [Kitasatospora sp. MAA4]|uniref:hypothetical protein n=1 Tax=Kitasatospora sp. MAA4 TaxID=3035093 RepID=UPI002472F169|nr:hypothetical protein [Kitasatospora sp. MAA4]MDH6137365.1 hypothetical protein [Kitasatospora sp. MAA4]